MANFRRKGGKVGEISVKRSERLYVYALSHVLHFRVKKQLQTLVGGRFRGQTPRAKTGVSRKEVRFQRDIFSGIKE